MCDVFNKNFLEIMNRYIPNKLVTINDKDAPWMTNVIKNKIKRKNKKFKQWKDSGSLLIKTQYKQMQSDLKNL